MQDLGHQGDARPQFPGQADAGDKAERRVGRQRADHAVGEVGQGVEEDGGEHDFEPPLAVAEHPPEDATDQHPGHLHVEKKDPGIDQFLACKAKGFETWYPHDAEQHQVVDIDKITEGGDNDRQAEDLPQVGGVICWHDIDVFFEKPQ